MPNVVMTDVEIFEAGLQTDSEQNSHEWTNQELEQIAEKFNARNPEESDIAPAVLGHPDEGTYPSDTAPAYGWLENVRVVGTKLVGDFRDCAEEFVQWVKDKRYSNRSIALSEDLDIRHVAFLGAALPAVKGLAPVQFKFTTDKKMRVYSFAESPVSPTTEPAQLTPSPASTAVGESRNSRSTQYKITAIAGKGYDEKPTRLSDLTDEQFGDPVNYRFPLTEEFINNSIQTWSKEYTQDQYTESDRSIIMARILSAMVNFGFQIPSYWCYKESKKSISFSFGKNHIHVPADLLTRKQLLAIVEPVPTQVTPSPQIQSTAPNSLPTIKQEFSQMVTVEQVQAELQKLLEAVTAGLPTHAATMYAPLHQSAVEAINALFAADTGTTDPISTNSEGTQSSEPAFTEREKQMQAQLAENNQRLASLEADKRYNQNKQFCEKAIANGNIMPTHEPLVMGLLDSLDLIEPNRPGGMATFSEGNKQVKNTPVALFKKIVGEMKQFNFDPTATKDNAYTKKSVSVDSGLQNVSEESAEKHARIIEFQEAKRKDGITLTYEQCARQVSKGDK